MSTVVIDGYPRMAIVYVFMSTAWILTVALDVKRSRIVLSAHTVVMSHWRRGRVDLPLAGLIGVSAPVAARSRWRSSAPRVVALRSVRDDRVRLIEHRWRTQDLERLTDHLGIERLTWVATPREIEERVPGATNRFQLLPLATQFLAITLGAAAVIAIGIAADLF